MGGPGHICLMTSHFTNVKYTYVRLWLVIYALCLTAECPPLLSNPLRGAQKGALPHFLPQPHQGKGGDLRETFLYTSCLKKENTGKKS